MSQIPAFTVILTSVVLILAILFRQPSKETVYRVQTPSFISDRVELTDVNQSLLVDGRGNITIK